MSINVVDGFLQGRSFTIYEDKYLIGLNNENKIAKIPLTCIASVVKKEVLKDLTFYDITFTDQRKITVNSTNKVYELLYKAQYAGARTPFTMDKVEVKPTLVKLGWFAVVIAFIIFVYKCNGGTFSSSTPEASTLPPVAAAPVAYFSDEELCRATISALFSKPVKIISVYQHNANEVRVKYTRKADRTVWKNKCKIEGETIVWGAVDPDRVGNENAGRWRIRYAEGDEKISYNATSEKLYLTVSDELGDNPRHYQFAKSDF